MVKCLLYFCCVLFAQNGPVNVKDMKGLGSMVSAFEKFASELERLKKTL